MWVHHFQHCRVERDDTARVLRTIFEDGSECLACPVFDRDRPMAERLGYGSDDAGVLAMWREHDWLHSFLAEELGWRWSRTLWDVAHDAVSDLFVYRQHYAAEEKLVCGFQHYLNGGPPPNAVPGWLIEKTTYAFRWAYLKEQALALLRGE